MTKTIAELLAPAELIIEFYDPLTGLESPDWRLNDELKRLISMDNAAAQLATMQKRPHQLTPVADLCRLAVENLTKAGEK